MLFMSLFLLSVQRPSLRSFFVHLVNVLGPEDYLLPVCLLLVEKVANRVVRQSAEEAKSTFALPISILHHYDGVLQNSVRVISVSLTRAEVIDPIGARRDGLGKSTPGSPHY